MRIIEITLQLVACFNLQVDEANVVKDVKQYTYMDGDDYVFMDMVRSFIRQCWAIKDCLASPERIVRKMQVSDLTLPLA